MSGLFSTFNIAKRGINVQQRTIDVTTHNITNVKTPGYSRQRAKIETTRAHGGVATGGAGAGQVGTGAQVAAIERIRDNFLDYQIRGETSVVGKYDVRNRYLFEVETIFNEPSENGLSTLLGKFFDGFQELSKQPSSSNARTVATQQALALTDGINHTYNQLEKLQDNAKMMLKSNISEINSYLDQINRLNEEIISVTTAGHAPNDLLDKRDLLLDQLSYKFDITVDKEKFNGIDLKPTEGGKMNSLNLVSASPNTETARFSIVSGVEKDKNDENVYVISYYKKGNSDNSENLQTLRVTGMSEEDAKKIKESGVLWANEEGQATKGDGYPIDEGQLINFSELMVFSPTSGEVSGNISIQADIQKFMDELDNLARAIAFSVNAIHSGEENGLNDDMPFFVNSSIAKYNSNGLMTNLDSILENEKNISAKN
ncbi:MAG: flagellar hook-associated protein FlgK, partial [Clostridium sp.]